MRWTKLPAEWWYLRGYARLFLSVGYLMSGDLTQAYATIYVSRDPDRSQDYQKLLLGCACFPHWLAADLPRLAQAARQVVAMSDPADFTQIVTWSHYHLGLYHYQCNDLSAAEQHLLPLVMRPHASDASCFLNSAVLLARIRQAQNRPQEAREIVDALLSFALEIRSEPTLQGARAFQAELALRQGRLAEAYHWAETSGVFVPRPAPHAHVPALTQALILLVQDTPASRQQARQLLAQMADYYTSIHYTVVRIRILALQAMLHYAEGDEQQALATLEKSIVLAEPGGFLRLFVDLGPQLEPLFTALARRGVSPTYLAAIVRLMRKPTANRWAWLPRNWPPQITALSGFRPDRAPDVSRAGCAAAAGKALQQQGNCRHPRDLRGNRPHPCQKYQRQAGGAWPAGHRASGQGPGVARLRSRVARSLPHDFDKSPISTPFGER